MARNQGQGGENKNPKIYIYVYIYIYLYIYEVCIHKKRKENTQNFQNRQSVFFQMCPLLATPSGNININIINYKLKIKVGSFAVQQPCQTSQSGSLRPEAPTSGVQKHHGGAGVWLLHSEKKIKINNLKSQSPKKKKISLYP